MTDSALNVTLVAVLVMIGAIVAACYLAAFVIRGMREVHRDYHASSAQRRLGDIQPCEIYWKPVVRF